MGPYTIAAKPTGPYASRLEAEWARFFSVAGWPSHYTGDDHRAFDFLLQLGDEWVNVEVKPLTGNSGLVTSAVVRAVAEGLDRLVVLEGPPPPRASRWWYTGTGPDGRPRAMVVRPPWQAEVALGELVRRWEQTFLKGGR